MFGAEQWPECLNPITSCANVGWAWTTVLSNVMPFALVLDAHGNYVASPLIEQVPSIQNGGLTQSPFTVSYRLDPKAVWADGTPITSPDFAFTWDAILHTKGTLSTAGYEDISSIDATDPRTARIHFTRVVANWADLFGGAGGGLLEEAAFPREKSHTGHIDLSGEMQDMIPFSGGPWLLKSWSSQQAVLVRNTRYWAHQPYLDQVTFVPREDQATEVASLLSGEVSAIWPQPSDVNLFDQFAPRPEIRAIGGESPNFEALWFNDSRPPLDDPMVREALMYAVDRRAIVDTLVKLNDSGAKVLNCGFIALPTIGPWCQGPGGTPFAPFRYDPGMVARILQGDGYVLGSDGLFQKDGTDLVIEWSTVAGNRRRESTQALEIEKAKAAGIKLVVRNYRFAQLVDHIVTGDFGVTEVAVGVGPDPSIEGGLGCDQFPTAKNGYTGGNYIRWCDQPATDLMKQTDLELDRAVRQRLIQRVYALEAQDFMSLPLYALPVVAAWRADRIAGPIGSWNSSFQGLFGNMDQWYCVRPEACG